MEVPTYENGGSKLFFADLEPLNKDYRQTAQQAYGPFLDVCSVLHGISAVRKKSFELEKIFKWGLEKDNAIQAVEDLTPNDEEFKFMLKHVPKLMVDVPKHLNCRDIRGNTLTRLIMKRKYPLDVSLNELTREWVDILKNHEPWDWDTTRDPTLAGRRFMFMFVFFIDALNNFIGDSKDSQSQPPEWQLLLPEKVTHWAEAECERARLRKHLE